jgi:hypothetical protein
MTSFYICIDSSRLMYYFNCLLFVLPLRSESAAMMGK